MFAREVHKDQRRKYTNNPYFDHLAEVAGIVSAVAQITGRGEELLANWFGWMNRTLEATAVPEDIPWLWRQYAFRGYLALQRVDVALLEERLPPQVFYNLMIAGRKPR